MKRWIAAAVVFSFLGLFSHPVMAQNNQTTIKKLNKPVSVPQKSLPNQFKNVKKPPQQVIKPMQNQKPARPFQRVQKLPPSVTKPLPQKTVQTIQKQNQAKPIVNPQNVKKMPAQPPSDPTIKPAPQSQQHVQDKCSQVAPGSPDYDKCMKAATTWEKCKKYGEIGSAPFKKCLNGKSLQSQASPPLPQQSNTTPVTKERAYQECMKKKIDPHSGDFAKCVRGQRAHATCIEKGLSPGSPKFGRCLKGRIAHEQCEEKGLKDNTEVFRECFERLFKRL